MTTNATIQIQPRFISGSIQAIPSKSDGHRQLISAALSSADTTLVIGPEPLSDDIQSTINCIRALGARVVRADDQRLLIHPVRRDLRIPTEVILDCGESGSTLRFMLPIVAALGRTVQVIGHGRLPDRPIQPLVDMLSTHGISFSGPKLPLKMSGQLSGGVFRLPGDISSQYVSGLLFALPLLDEDSEIQLTTALESAAYVDMTLNTLKIFGVRIELRQNGYFIPGGQKFVSPEVCVTEGDWSNGAFFLCAGAMNTPVNVAGLPPNSAQPDAVILSTIQEFGADALRVRNGFSVFPKPLKGIIFSARNAPDLVPIVSVLACAAQGTTRIINAGRLRIKESDRLHALCTNLSALGASVEEDSDAMTIYGTGHLIGGSVDAFGDHRIVMAMAIASTIAEKPILISGWNAVEKSYPTFFEDFRSLGGIATLLGESS